MRKIYAVPFIVLLMLSAGSLWGQTCSNTATGTSCTRSNFFFGEILPNNGCGTFSSNTTYSPGEYFQVPVLQGGCYTVSTCGSAINTQISAFEGSATTGPFAFNDDNGPDCNSTQASIVMVPTFTDYARVDIREFNCAAGGSQSVTVKLRQNNNLSITSAATDMVTGDVRALTAVPATVTVPTQLGSGDVGTFSGTGVSGTNFTAPLPAAASGTYTITYTFGYCTTTQQITVFRQPSASVAGTDQTVCDSTITLAANSPQYGVGNWAVLSGPGSVAAPGSPTSNLNGLQAGTPTVLTWTISNGPATPSVDTVTITREAEPTTPNAGLDQDVCDTSATMAANSPVVGNGGWTLIGGSGSLVNALDPNTAVGNLGIGPNTFRWTISNGVCPPKTDDIVITRSALPSNALAGTDQNICDSTTTLVANSPNVGSGAWTIVSGTGTVSNIVNPNSVLDGVQVGTTVLAWTVTNGACPASSDTVSIIRNAAPAPPTASGLTSICSGASAQLTATSGSSTPTFLWWDQLVGGNTLSSNTVFNTGPLTDTTTYWLVVTDGQTNCRSERAPITVNVLPAPEVDLGADTSLCANESLCLSAGSGFNGYLWSDNSVDSTNCISGSGDFWVIVTDANNCQGGDTINLASLGIASLDIGPADTAFCTGGFLSIGTPSDPNLSYLWSTGDMVSAISVTTGGQYYLTAVDSNNCSVSDTMDVNELDVPVVNFSVDSSNCPLLVFTDNSSDATGWIWDFGDGGAGSSQQNPVYDYTNAGNGSYTVQLTADNICGVDSASISLELGCVPVGLDRGLPQWEVSLYPNPNQGIFRVEWADLLESAELEVYDLTGRLVWRRSIADPTGQVNLTVDLRDEAKGSYLVRLRVGDQSVTRRVIIQ